MGEGPNGFALLPLRTAFLGGSIGCRMGSEVMAAYRRQLCCLWLYGKAREVF